MFLGSRAGSNSAAAWATLLSFGKNEYVRRCREIVRHARMIAEGIKEIDGIEVYIIVYCMLYTNI